MKKRHSIAVCLMMLLASRAYSATEVEFINERTVDGEKQSYIINAIFQGLKSRYTFHNPEESGAGGQGYLLSLDGGETAYFIDADENTCRQWRNDELAETLSDFLLETSDKFNIKTRDGEFNKVFEKEAADIHGQAVKHIRLQLNFTGSYKYLLFKDTVEVKRTVDMWVTPALEFLDAQSFLQKSWEHTGDEKLDQAIQAFTGKANESHRLRSEIKQTMTDKKGKVSNTQILQYVQSIRQLDDLPDREFQLPDCHNTDSVEMEKKFKALLKASLG